MHHNYIFMVPLPLKVLPTMIGFVIGNPLLEIVIFFEGFHFPSCDLLYIEHEIKHIYH